MISRRLLLLSAAAFPLAAQAAFGIAQLMHELAQNKGGRARFVETRTVAMLDRPVVLHGELLYQPPDRLVKRTLEPEPETLTLDGNVLTIDSAQQHLKFDVANRPEALAFVESVRSTLGGNRKALDKYFWLDLSGTQGDWTLELTPKSEPLRRLVQRVEISGKEGQVLTIEYLQADGDRTRMDITPIGP